MLIYDTIIVGSGPAGATLAYRLAKHGLQVLLIEKATLPRYKVCGGGVTAKAVRALPFDASPVFEVEAEGGVLAYGGQPLLKITVQPPAAYLVMRDRFDHFLVEQAVKAGTRLVDGLAVTGIEERDGLVTVPTPQGELRSRLLAGADGVNSLVARSVGLLAGRAVGVAVEAEVAVSQSALDGQGPYATFDFGALPNGYGWVFPKKDHLSIGVFQARPGKAPGLRQSLESYIASQPEFRDNEWLSLRGHHVPLGGRMAALHTGRVLLLGDAANLADPWLGEGIAYAIQSAQIAAEVMIQALEGRTSSLSSYTARVNAQIVRQLAHAGDFARLVYRFPRLGSALLHRSAAMQKVVYGVIRGDITFEQLKLTLLKQLPKILTQGLGL